MHGRYRFPPLSSEAVKEKAGILVRLSCMRARVPLRWSRVRQRAETMDHGRREALPVRCASNRASSMCGLRRKHPRAQSDVVQPVWPR